MSVLVSILIPTYCRATYLRSSIRSALAQTHSHIEVIVLDDASPDETPAVVAEFAGDPRLRSVRHARNQGIVGNWQAGIEQASGEFFCLLHDDDTLEPSFVEHLLEPLGNDADLVLSFCDHWVMSAEEQRLFAASDAVSRRWQRHRLGQGRLKDFARTALVNQSIPVGGALFRLSEVQPGALSPKAQGAIDMWLLYQCVRTGKGAYYLPERLMNYREHIGGMSAARPAYMAEGQIFRCRQMLNDPEMKPLWPDLRQELAHNLTTQGIDLLTRRSTAGARQALGEALRTRPSRRALAAFVLSCGGQIGAATSAAWRGHRAAAGEGR